MPANPPVADWRGLRVWVVGASSGIGAALARELLTRGARVALSARRREALELVAARAPENARVLPLDVTDAAGVDAARADLEAAWGGIDIVMAVAGDYKPMAAAEPDLEAARRMLRVNVEGVMNVVVPLARRFAELGRGGIGIVSSVAGYRGLPKALAYGSSKAALIHLAEVLYLELARRGVAVWLVNPGFVKSALTDKNDFRMPAIIEPAEAARHILRGMEQGRFEIHFPKRFTLWLKLLRLLPYRWYFPLVRRATGLK